VPTETAAPNQAHPSRWCQNRVLNGGWPVALAIVVTVVLHLALPGKYGDLPILVPRRAQG